MEIIQSLVSAGLLLLGTMLLLISAIGVIRLPDLYTRMSATSKATSLGAACVLLGVAVAMADAGVTVRAIVGVIFLFLTAPIAAHLIGRAAYLMGVPLWKGSVVDDLRGHYDRRYHTLSSIDARPMPESEQRTVEEAL